MVICFMTFLQIHQKERVAVAFGVRRGFRREEKGIFLGRDSMSFQAFAVVCFRRDRVTVFSSFDNVWIHLKTNSDGFWSLFCQF